MRPTGMKQLALAAAATLLVCGCGAQSGSAAGAPTTSPVATAPSSAPTTPVATAPAAPSAHSLAPINPSAGPKPAAGTAHLVYTAPAGHPPMRVSRSVTGSVFTHLVGVINDLSKPVADAAECNLDTGEQAVITFVQEGHTLVYSVPGVPCRQVTVTSDGVPQPPLANSAAMIGAIRAIVGLKGLAHPLTG